MPLYHTEYKVPETWNQPEIAAHVETALRLRSKVNTLADRHTWELSGTITASKDNYESLSVSDLFSRISTHYYDVSTKKDLVIAE